MQVTAKVLKILQNYDSTNPGVKRNLAHILMSGKLKGTGKMVILPVDQGFEHGPGRSFAKNPQGYDPLYHVKLAIDAGLTAYAAPLGMIEFAANYHPGEIPLILKMNSSNSLNPKNDQPYQAMFGTVDDALRLGCSAVGFTIYPGSGNAMYMIEEVSEIIREAKSKGLATVVWSYPRGGDLTKEDETALDIVSYAAHIASLIGADIIKVKPPSDKIAKEEAKKVYQEYHPDISTLSKRIAHVMQSSFDGKKLVVFSGGTAKSEDDLLKEISEIAQGGASGSIIGRNSFQRSKDDAIKMLDKVMQIYQSV